MRERSFEPSALIVGAQKAGTTAMMQNLCRHSRIHGSRTEHNFFTANWSKGAEWYSNKLAKTFYEARMLQDGDVLLEKSPSYLASPEAAQRISEFRPDMKIIICLRNPTERAYSRYNDIMVDEPGRLNKSFLELVRSGVKIPNHFIKNGMYKPQVARYFDLFGRENVKVVIQERWKRLPFETIADVAEFLGFSDMPEFEVQSVHSNSYASGIDPEAADLLNDFYKEWNEDLFALLGEPIPEWG